MDNLKNIFARNCKVVKIDRPTAAGFLRENHRLGSTVCRHCYALVSERRTGAAEDGFSLKGQIVAVATFSNSRKLQINGKETASYEWIRYASLRGIRVVGGMGKLLNAFIEDKHPGDVMSYSDPSSSDNGDVYRQLGFKSEGIVEIHDAFNKESKIKVEKFRFSPDYTTSFRQPA